MLRKNEQIYRYQLNRYAISSRLRRPGTSNCKTHLAPASQSDKIELYHANKLLTLSYAYSCEFHT